MISCLVMVIDVCVILFAVAGHPALPRDVIIFAVISFICSGYYLSRSGS